VQLRDTFDVGQTLADLVLEVTVTPEDKFPSCVVHVHPSSPLGAVNIELTECDDYYREDPRITKPGDVFLDVCDSTVYGFAIGGRHLEKGEFSTAVQLCSITVWWSNFDPREQKMGVFLQSTEVTPCGNFLK
jgi:hypothetical protein